MPYTRSNKETYKVAKSSFLFCFTPLYKEVKIERKHQGEI